MKDMLLGRLALVTGAGRGNGAAIARGLAAAGAEVIVTDIDKDAARMIADSIVAEGCKARGFMLDVTDEESCAKKVDRSGVDSGAAPAFKLRPAAIALSALLDGFWVELSLSPTVFKPRDAIALCEDWVNALCSGAFPRLLTTPRVKKAAAAPKHPKP